MGDKSVKSPKMYVCNTILALITDLTNGSKTIHNYCQCACTCND